MEKENKKKDEKISKLEQRIKDLESENKGFSASIDELEQYSRRKCLLLHGIKEDSKEDTDDVAIKSLSQNVDIELDKKDADRTHHAGKPSRSDRKPDPIITKFARYNVRRDVYSNKRKLKGKNFLITESLTVARVKLLRQAQTKYGVHNIWTFDERILFKRGNFVLQYKGQSLKVVLKHYWKNFVLVLVATLLEWNTS